MKTLITVILILSLAFASGCASRVTGTVTGTAVGAGTGAGVGYLFGKGPGALLGGAVGAVGGGIIGFFSSGSEAKSLKEGNLTPEPNVEFKPSTAPQKPIIDGLIDGEEPTFNSGYAKERI